MKRIWIFALIVLILPIASFADFYQSTSGPNGEYTLTLQINSSQLKLIPDDNKFTQIELPDAVALGKPGDPSLPIISRFVNVTASEYTATIEVSNPKVFSGIKVYPVQPDHKENAPKKPFTYNKNAYAENQKPFVRLGELVSVGNGKALAIRVNPFARQGDQITLYQTIKIHLKPAANAKPIVLEESHHSLFHFHQQNLLISNSVLNRKLTVPTQTSSVLVLTSTKLLDDAKAYAVLHPEFAMEVVAIKEGSTFNDVKQMISNRYAQGKLDTVVLYGDEIQVPEAQWGYYNSDSFYQYLDPSQPNYTQIAIGRIPAQNHSDAKFYNEKLAMYLKSHIHHDFKNVMLIAHNQGYPQGYTANQEAIRNAPNPMGFVYHTEYGGLNATNANVIEDAPKHYELINYRGHGSDQEWWAWDKNNQSFGANQVALLKNNDENVSVFFNIACETGTFESPTRNMSENLLFMEENGSTYRGGIAVLGASSDSYTAVNNNFDIHLFEFLEKQNSLPLGHLIAAANDKLVLENGGQMQDNVQMYVLLGDPLITLW